MKFAASIALLIVFVCVVSAQRTSDRPQPAVVVQKKPPKEKLVEDPLESIALTDDEKLLIGERNIHREYDRFEDRTRYLTDSYLVGLTSASPGETLQVSGYFYFRGTGAGHPIESIGLVFWSKSREWKYLKDAELFAIVDGKRLPLGQPKRRDSDVKPATDIYSSTQVLETLQFRIPYLTMRKVAAGDDVEMRMGGSVFQLPADFLTALKVLLVKVEPMKPAPKRR